MPGQLQTIGGSKRKIDDYFPAAIANGEIAGHSVMKKFGRNPVIDTGTDPEDVWDGGGIYAFITELAGGSQDSGSKLKISSGSTDDDAGGTGALTVDVSGLDANYAEQSETVIMDGQTAVETSGTYTRIFRMIVRSAGTGNGNAGIIYAGTGNITTGVPDNIYAQIGIGNNQTLMAIYTIPAGKTGYLTRYYASINKKTTATTAEIQLLARPDGEVFQIKRHMSIVNLGSSALLAPQGIPEVYAAKTDIKLHCAEVSASTVDLSGGFDIILKDN